ncbi:MAG: Hsp70 family protein [Pirellulaceae bacterium]
MSAQYVLGIDLGTTNCVLAYAPLDAESPQVQLLDIPQLVSPATIETRKSLPSFIYLANKHEATGGAFDLPWADERQFAVGELARRQAAEMPDRTISAAKSWLCHGRVNRRDPILPWQAPDEVEKISPVTASQRLLEHLIAAWNHAHPEAPLGQQRVVLTVPASFDAVARELTREAALAAGLPGDLVLLEEPQAAVYAWLAATGDRWRKILKVGDHLLVCDIGGGTTDLTMIRPAEHDGELVLERVAVGNHLLVGGDNMDLALAHMAAGEFAGQGAKLNPWQSVSLWHACRAATGIVAGSRRSRDAHDLGAGTRQQADRRDAVDRSGSRAGFGAAGRRVLSRLWFERPAAASARFGLSRDRIAVRARHGSHSAFGRVSFVSSGRGWRADGSDPCVVQRWRVQSRRVAVAVAGGVIGLERSGRHAIARRRT